MACFGHISAIAEEPSYIKTNHHESTYRRRRTSEVIKRRFRTSEPRSLKPAECRFTAPRQGLTLPWSMSNVFHFLCSLFDIDGIHAGKTRGAKLALEKARRGNHPFVRSE